MVGFWTMDVHEPRTKFAQLRNGDAFIVDPCAALARGGNRATKYMAAEIRLDFRLLCTVAYGAGVGPRPERKFKRSNQYRLPRSCLAGNDIQPRGEIRLKFLDNSQIGDSKTFQHDDESVVSLIS